MITSSKSFAFFLLIYLLLAVFGATNAQDLFLQVFDSKNKEIGSMKVFESRGSKYILLEDILKIFGGTTKIEPQFKRITFSLNNKKTILILDSQKIRVDNQEFSLSNPTIQISGKFAVTSDFLTRVISAITNRKIDINWEEEKLQIGREISNKNLEQTQNSSQITQYNLSGFRIIIDPGHGGYDIGAKSKDGLLEKDLNLDIALRIKDIFSQKEGVEVYLTREEDKYMIPEERVSFANDLRGDVFLSIHFNWSPSQDTKGFNIFVNSDKARISLDLNSSFEPAETSSYEGISSKSRLLTKEIRDRLSNIISTGGKCKEAPLAVMDGLFMPGVLLEVLYLSSPDDLNILYNPDFFDSLSFALCDSILSFGTKIKS